MYVQCELVDGQSYLVGWLPKKYVERNARVELNNAIWYISRVYSLFPQPRRLLGWVIL